MWDEMRFLWSALFTYVIAGVISIAAVFIKNGKFKYEIPVILFIFLGLSMHAASLIIRWERLGHGPFNTMFEILSSNIFSLILIFAIAFIRFKIIRPVSAVVMPVIFIMMGWLIVSDPFDSHLPPSFNTIWLYIHVGFGKIFFGALIVSLGLAIVIFFRKFRIMVETFSILPNDNTLEDIAYRFMAFGMIFDTLMLVTGAIWAQNAWGRYWAWDPLEIMSLITWLLMGFAIHLRVTFKVPNIISALLIFIIFAVAFLTFFGIPFVSKAPHQGVV